MLVEQLGDAGRVGDGVLADDREEPPGVAEDWQGFRARDVLVGFGLGEVGRAGVVGGHRGGGGGRAGGQALAGDVTATEPGQVCRGSYGLHGDGVAVGGDSGWNEYRWFFIGRCIGMIGKYRFWSAFNFWLVFNLYIKHCIWLISGPRDGLQCVDHV